MVEQDRNLSVMKGMKQLDATLMHPVESMFSFSKNTPSPPLLEEKACLPRSLSLNKPFGDTMETFNSVPSAGVDSFFPNLTRKQNLKSNMTMCSNGDYDKQNCHHLDPVPNETWMKPDTYEEPLEDFLHRLISKNEVQKQTESLPSSKAPCFPRTVSSYVNSASDTPFVQSKSRDLLKEKRNAEATFALKNLLRIPPTCSSFDPLKKTLNCNALFLQEDSNCLVPSCTTFPDTCYPKKESEWNQMYDSLNTKTFHDSYQFPDFQDSKPLKGHFKVQSCIDKTSLESFFNKVPLEFQETPIFNKTHTSQSSLQDANVNMNIQGASIPLFSYETSSVQHCSFKNPTSILTEKANKCFYDSKYLPHSTQMPYFKKDTLSPFFSSTLSQSDSYYYPFNGTSCRMNSNLSVPHGRRKFMKSTPHSTDSMHHSLYNLSLCFPITLPYGKIHVTKASGENFYSFTDSDLCPDETIRQNASLLFSPVAGLCDAWATFLHIQAGFIQNVKADDIQRLVDLFHIVMKSDPTPLDLFQTPLKFICKGVQPHQNKHQTYWKFKSPVSDKKLETYAFLQESIGFQQFLFLKQKLTLLKDAINAVYNRTANLNLFNTTLFNAITTLKQATLSSSNDPLTFATLFDPFNTPNEQLVKDTIQLPILIREYGQVENPELEERFIKDKDFVETHQVPNVEISELRIEHQSKKMVDPRFRDNFVLTRQMAGDENPRKWTTQKEHTTPFHTKQNVLDTKNKPTLHQETQSQDLKKVDGPLPTNNSMHPPYDPLYSLPKTASTVHVLNKSPEMDQTSCPIRSLQNTHNKNDTDKKTSTSHNSIGRYQFCFNADIPLIEIAYRDAKDCLSSTHGFIYMRHLMAQKQSH